MNCKLLGRMLSHFNVEYEVARNGQEAVDTVLRSQNVTEDPDAPFFCLILMDMCMPVLSGTEAIKVLRRNGVEVPIVALTADGERTETVFRCRTRPAYGAKARSFMSFLYFFLCRGAFIVHLHRGMLGNARRECQCFLLDLRVSTSARAQCALFYHHHSLRVLPFFFHSNVCITSPQVCPTSQHCWTPCLELGRALFLTALMCHWLVCSLCCFLWSAAHVFFLLLV
jgi:CheY-like chemotaxis protein